MATHDVQFEFILVDNGSTDATKSVFDAAAAHAPFPARYVFEEKRGVGHALSAGYRASKGDIIAFTDDDCYPAADLATNVISAFDDPALGVVTGRILLHDLSDIALTIENSPRPVRYAAGRYVRPGQFTGANLAFRRAALDMIGGFDPLFGPGSFIGSAADCDAAARVCLAGWDGAYDPGMVVHHHHGRNEIDRAALMRRYGIGSGGYHMKLLLSGWIRHFNRYLLGIPRRLTRHPRSIYWEYLGAQRYARHWLATRLANPLVPPAGPGRSAGLGPSDQTPRSL
jgi:glycosyltransferase involved in cell wall biosynthesis